MARSLDADLQSLKNDVSRLAQTVIDLAGEKGSDAYRRALKNADSLVSEAGKRGHRAVDATRDAAEDMAGVIDESIRERPYATLALAIGVGIVIGALMRR